MNNKKYIPFNNLKAQNTPLVDQYLKAFSRIIESGNYVSNEEVIKFEKDMALFITQGTPFEKSLDNKLRVIACSNGTSAIEISLRALNLENQAEVLVPGITFVATVEAILSAGLKPVLVDIDAESWTMDCSKIENSITQKTKVILPVNLHGKMANLEKIWKIARKYNLIVIEDSAQAFNAKINSISAGVTQSKATTFSFYPGKNLGALGEAGAITTFDEDFYELCMRIRNWGVNPSKDRYNHEIRGNNFRMDEIQGAVLSLKLKKINEWTKRRIQVGERYIENLGGNSNIQLPSYNSSEEVHVFHVFNILIPDSIRSSLRNELLSLGIETGMHYPRAIHENRAYENLGLGKSLNNSEYFSKSCLSLPINESMTLDDVDCVSENILKFLRTL